MAGSEDDGEWSPWEKEEDPEESQPLIPSEQVPGQADCVNSSMESHRSSSPILGRSSPTRKVQYFTAFSATMGALAMGAVLGYSSPAGPLLMSNATAGPVHLTKAQNSFFSSSMNLGALAGGPIGGVCLNKLGRRGTMLTSVVPFVGGWLLIAFAQNFAMLMTGRIITGFCAGITSLVVPTYIGEFASPDIRGTLGSGFQLMVTIGVVYAYAIGAVVKTWQMLAGLCIIPVLIYFVMVFFAKESPNFLLSKGKLDKATESLQHFRGKDYNIQTELNMLQQTVEDAKRNKASFKDLLKPYILKPLLISLTLMFFQQYSGVNPVLFNLTTIFEDSGSTISDSISSITIGVVQVLATLLATVLMDKAGRKLLLIVSASMMALSLTALGEFFYVKMEDEAWAVETLGWLPLASLIIFIAAFSIGYGPIPWLMMGELFSPNVKEAAAGLATMVNWTLSFSITLIFVPLQDAINDFGVYWLFAGVCVLNLIFSVTVVPETKGKTLEEISAYFGGPVISSDSHPSRESDA
ncbi:facilitated trehalose transporter Tret1-like [Penaeus indicus]|uniref:facilitated trehalose transporter Tret1-like n=1 Tax=Penaeus indicus TaxID=29960 RepID=UPI00300D3CF3